MTNSILNIFTYATTLKEQPLYIASVAMIFGTGAVLGPVIGGALSDSSATWRWAFYINLVLFGVCAPVLFFVLKPMNPQPDNKATAMEKLRRMDWLGIILNIAPYTFFVLAFTFGGAVWSWSAGGTITFIVLFGASNLVFILQQIFTIGTTREYSIFPVDLLKDRTQWLLYIATACGGTAFFIPLYYIPIYFQFVHDEGGMETAVHLLPLLFIIIFAMMLNGGLLPVTRYMPWYVAAAVFQVIGGAIFYACVDVNTSNSTIYGFSVLIALGGGLAMQGSYTVSSIKAGKRAPESVGFINIAQLSGILLALTISSAIFQNQGYHYLAEALAGRGFTPVDIHAALAGQKSRILVSATPEVKASAVQAIVRAINEEYVLVIAGGALALITSLFMKMERTIPKAAVA